MWSWCKQTEVGSTDNRIGTNDGYIRYQANTDPNNYNFTYVKGLLTVTPAETHPVVPEINRMYNGSPTNFVVTVPSEEIANPEIKYSTDGGKTWTKTPPVYTDVTNTPVMYVVEDPSGNHAAVTNETRVVITPREITVSVNPAQMKMGEPEPAYSAIVTCDDNGEALDLGEVAKLEYNIGPTGIKVVGANTLHASGEQLQGNYKITYVDNILTIYDKDTLVYSLNGETVTYDGYGHGLTAEIGSGMPETRVRYALSEQGPWYDSLLAATNVSQDAGVPIWYALTPSVATYQAVTNVAIVKVVPKEITVTADDKSKRPNQADPELTVTIATLAVPDQGKTDLIVYDISRAAGETVGSYPITVTGREYQGNYRITWKNGTLTIENKLLAIDGKEQDPENLPVPHAAGTTDDNGTGVKNVLKTYDAKATNIVVTVTTPATGSTVRYAVLAPNATPTGATSWSPTVPKQTDAGTNKVWYIASAPDYRTVTNYAWVVILPKAATLTADSATKVYDGTALTCATFTQSGFVGSEGVQSVAMTAASTITNVGIVSNTIDQTTLHLLSNTKESNYTFKFLQGYLQVTQKVVTVTADDKEKVYGAADPTLTATVTGLVAAEQSQADTLIARNLSRTAGEGVGSYAITVTGTASQGNYKVGSWVPGTLYITAHEVETWVENVCLGTNTVGTAISGNEVFAECPARAGYCVDAQNSVTNGIVRRVDDPQGLLRLVVRYEKDSNGDDVPDKYQRKIAFRVMNGYWDSPRGYMPQDVWVTKYAADGKTWDVNGTGTLSSLPTAGNSPYHEAFTTGGSWWPSTPTKGMSVSNATAPLFAFAYDRPRGGANRAVSGSAVAHDFTSLATCATFTYVDGQATYAVGERTGTAHIVVVATPLEATEVIVKGADALAGDATAWQDIATKATGGAGYVTLDVGSYRYFKIEVR